MAFELLAWVVLLCLLLRVLSKLTDIYALIRPDAPAPPSLLSIPQLMVRKGMQTLYGAVFLILSKDKITKSQLARAPDADDIAGSVDREVCTHLHRGPVRAAPPEPDSYRVAGAHHLHPPRRVDVEPGLQPRLRALLPRAARQGRPHGALPHPV